MAARIGAILASILLIVGAFWFRSRPEQGSIVCDPLIADACRDAFGSDVTITPPADVLSQLIDGDVEPMVWITAQAWAEMASDQVINRSGDRPNGSESVAATAMVVASRGGACVDWDCLNASLEAGEKVGLDRLTTSTGITSAAILTGSRFGASASNSSVSPAYVRSLRSAASGTVSVPAAVTMVTMPGAFDATVTTDTVWSRNARAGFDGGPAGGDLVIVAASIGNTPTPSLGGLEDALADRGWGGASGEPEPLPLSPGMIWFVALDG